MSILFLAILNRKKKFSTVISLHKMRKPPLQMRSFWLFYMAIATDNLFIHELLGYIKLSLNHSRFFFCLAGLYFIATPLHSFNCLQNHLKLYNFDHDFEVRWKISGELFFSYFKIIITFTLLHTGPRYIKRNGTKRRETD